MPGAAAVTDRLDRARRWQLLLDELSRKQRLSVTDAAATLGVSSATVRRDFTALAQQQLVTRTHGGVVASAVAYDLPTRYRTTPGEPGAKQRIAAVAAGLVESGTVVGMNGGTTTAATARQVAARADLARSTTRPAVTVVTNALNIATEMVLRPHIRTVSLGGVARPESYELSGPLAALVLDELWLDLLFLGVDGLSVEGGASCIHEGEAGITAMMVQHADRVVVVCGSEKITRRAFARICETPSIHVLVTDRDADEGAVAAFRSLGVRVLCA